MDNKKVLPSLDLDFKEYISKIDNSDVFTAYKMALNNSKQTILAILEDKDEKESTLFIAGIAYRISMQMKKEMDDTNYEVQKILENALKV